MERPEVSQELKKTLLAEETARAGTLVISAIHGLGGIGKTILAQALAHDPQVQNRFCDGILWVTLGQEPDVLSLLQSWIIALKDYDHQPYDYNPTTGEAASTYLNSLLHDKAVLLVIDDGWNVEDIQHFRVGSGKCQVIITTRRADVAEEVDAQLYSLDLMSEEQSLMLLAKRLGRDLGEKEKEKAKQLAEAVGYLPIALDLAAARVARGKSWSELHSAFTAEIARLEVLEGVRRRKKQETRLEASFNLSLNVLREEFPEAWESFAWLGVLPEDVSIAAPMVATLWKVEVEEAADRLELFWNDALLLPGVPVRIDTQEWPTYRVHDLLHDLARRWLTTKQSPGLGLDIPSAHGILLERYHKKTEHGLWHTLPDDGYIYNQLIWHLEKVQKIDEIHQLLREETPSGDNGWYWQCDRQGKTTNFVKDVSRAWEIAEKNWAENSTKSISLQCLYALITSSLNSLAGNIPPELMGALLEHKIWMPAQGLAYALQIKDSKKKVHCLKTIIEYLPSSLLPEALEAARSIGNENYRAWALGDLAPHLPDALLPEALEAARSIGNENYRAWALGDLASHIPDVWSEALEAARSIGYEWDESDRAWALGDLAPHLPEALLPEALEAARSIGNERHRAEALGKLAPQFPEVLPEALEAARNIGDEYSRAGALGKLAPQFPEVLPEALEAARSIGYESDRAGALGKLAPHIPEVLPEALEAARNIGYERHRARVLGYLAPHLPDALLPEALEAARSIDDESDRAEALGNLIQRLTPSSIDFSFWKRTLHALASLNRPHLLSNIPQLAPLIIHFGSVEALRETVNAIRDVSRWWK